jgi:hypothetical protein
MCKKESLNVGERNCLKTNKLLLIKRKLRNEKNECKKTN